ncbi:SpoIIE family protein phosphatase [Streptomyces profundus]|uniref:SpoIIE family protein phosphatase n=1 Tax=Streptomyces profundus TaxID=2867410 RepID=UPI001D164A91|nr:SpoIIE family protein phosphatase [Streptomyces sp. MA3_2.13]UED82892.1 SpoIIE family protein phosphatase [Streptomyces sp. MA3_2.13]
MRAIPQPGDLGQPPGESVAMLVVGPEGEILATSEGSERLTGIPPEDLPGSSLTDLIPDPEGRSAALAGVPGRSYTSVRHRDGHLTRVRLDIFPQLLSDPGRVLVTLVDAAAARQQEEDQALVRALFSQQQVGLSIHAPDLLITRLNSDPNEWVTNDAELGLDHPLPVALHEIMDPEDAEEVARKLSRVAGTGEPLINWEYTYRARGAPEQERKLSVTSLRLEDSRDELLGVVSIYTDITEQHQTQRRMALLHTAAQRIGPSLDVTRNAEELAKVLVPSFTDFAAVDLGERVLKGDEPGPTSLMNVPVRRIAVAEAAGRWPEEVQPLGGAFRIEMPDDDAGTPGEAIRGAAAAALRTLPVEEEPPADAAPARLLLPSSPGSLMVVPLRARGQVLGTLALWRSPDRTPFGETDADLAEEVGSRAALSLDNARRYTREHRTLETLQRSLLPPAVFEVSAASTAGSYVPAETTAGIGGSWYDVIPLSSARVAFVMGDVAGHGLNATATMGRLRTAVQTLADMDLAPDELLTRLDDLAIRLAEFGPTDEGGQRGSIGATCLYCVYDPVSGECTLASAGRTPPLLAEPGEPAEVLPLRPGPALGVGGAPFETMTLRLGPQSVLAFFSEELAGHGPETGDPTGEGQDDGDGDGDGGEDGDGEGGEEQGGGAREPGRLAQLSQQITEAAKGRRSPAETGRGVLDQLLPDRAPANDVALLIARVRPLPPDSTADWQLPAEPAVVGRARDLVLEQLDAWDLTESAFPTELIVSELITNAIRYAGGPVGVRLIRDDVLICEVSDPSETQPHLRRARPTDEGGRGLFLVAQLAHRWGSRYTATGKTIWTEQPLG